jgi:hypothetical protein
VRHRGHPHALRLLQLRAARCSAASPSPSSTPTRSPTSCPSAPPPASSSSIVVVPRPY